MPTVNVPRKKPSKTAPAAQGKKVPRSSAMAMAKKSSPGRKRGRRKLTAKQTNPHYKTRRFKAGTVALREIRKYQHALATQLLIPKLPFQRLVREITWAETRDKEHHRFQSKAIEALQEAAEMFLVAEFDIANLLAIHAKRVTLMPRDMHLIAKLRRRFTGEEGF